MARKSRSRSRCDAQYKEHVMHEQKVSGVTAHRVAAFSDGVIAVIMTVMVLELKAPDNSALSDLWPLWPTVISYTVSYLFIAIIWINHAHLFMVSFLPFATAWVARTQLASAPVAVYAALFVCVDIAYNVFERDVLAQAHARHVSDRARRMARRRSLAVLAIFTTATIVAFVAPRLAFALICGALLLHVRPEAPGST